MLTSHTLHPPRDQTAPVVFASPHSGRAYPEAFLAASRLDALTLRHSEDSFVDELFAAAPAYGAPLLAANFPRAYCDPNREAWELDPAMFADPLPAWVNTASPRVQAGLGTIARVVSSGEAIYAGRLSFAEAQDRVERCWRPWHDALDGLVTATVARFGACLLIDCHSMPGRRNGATAIADIVLGDAYGTSCSPEPVGAIEQALRGRGFRTARNDPYAGGYITRHYGRPRHGVHAVQIELARDLYMDERRIEKSPGFDALRQHLAALIGTITGGAQEWLAAEPGLSRHAAQ